MMRSPHHVPYPDQRNGRAAVFVDYENLYELLNARLGNRAHPDEYISEILEQLRCRLLEKDQTEILLVSAFADFGELRGNGLFIQRTLLQQGIDLRCVAAAPQPNAAELQLCIEAMEVLHRRPDIQAFVLLTGDRAYLPLVRQVRRHGVRVLVICVDPLRGLEELPERELFRSVSDLLDGSTASLHPTDLNGADHAPGVNGVASVPARAEPYQRVGDAALRTLEIIEEHFGQYDEVYLTPLLRKLSELLGDQEPDPKTIVSDLETAGAVWLEKRRGYPYDYTVLIVDAGHPDVEEIQKKSYRQEQEDGPYDDDSYYDDEARDAYDAEPGDAPRDYPFADEPDAYEDEDWEERQH